MEIKRVTNGPKHHFFGFHDLKITDASNRFVLTLEVENISRPPLKGEVALSGVVELGGDGRFFPIHSTCAFNYPQGARQQWFGDSTLFTTNDKVNNCWGARLSDALICKEIDFFSFPIHCLNGNNGDAFYMNYSRLYRNAVYGYIGIKDDIKDDIPKTDGIWISNIKTKESKLLVSTYDVAKCGEKKVVKTGYMHYLTHLVLNPSCNRIAFLHRYRVADGGEITRLMTIGTDGTELRCLAKGFLSHFDWLDDNSIIMWGEHQPNICKIRESRFLTNPILLKCVHSMKDLRNSLIRKSIDRGKSGVQQVRNRSFMIISDSKDPIRIPNGIGVLVSDGHPMTNPINRKKIIIDNYPQSDRCRTLMLYDYESQEKRNIGKFRMIDDDVDETLFNVEDAYWGVDKKIRKVYPHKVFMHSRSGLHCDLHPRWSYDGETAYFDSIHEGSRQIYSVNLKKYL